ncbi:hypothetical protein ACJA88_014376 [Fusarium oxysporum]
MDTSIVSHSVTIEHNSSLSARTISKEPSKAGYEVDTVIPDPIPGETSPNGSCGGPDDDFPFAWLNQAVERWNRSRKAAEEGKKRRRHMEHCEQCRAQHRETSPFVVADSASEPTKVFQASISITGMSCSSCVGKITAALEQKPWVRSASVALLTQSATVAFDGEQNVEELVKIIDSIGYEANLEHVDELPRTCGRPLTPSTTIDFSQTGGVCLDGLSGQQAAQANRA